MIGSRPGPNLLALLGFKPRTTQPIASSEDVIPAPLNSVSHPKEGESKAKDKNRKKELKEDRAKRTGLLGK